VGLHHGHKKLKGGVAMENPGRMNFIIQLARMGAQGGHRQKLSLGADREAFKYVDEAQEGKCRNHGGPLMIA